MSVIKSFEQAIIKPVEQKFPTPEIWAEKAVKTLGFMDAAKICRVEGRPMIGTKNDEPNPNAKWYNAARGWIINRFPKAKDA